VLDGHCHPKVVAAIQKQAAELIHMSGTDFTMRACRCCGTAGKTMPGSEEKKSFLHKFGHRSGGRRDEAGALCDETRQDDCVFTAGFMDGRWVRCR